MDAKPSFLYGGGRMGDLINEFDWSATSIGPIGRWPQSLRTAVNIMLNSNHPMWIGWGKEMTFLYNDAYLSVLGPSKHPWALGRKADAVWKEIWHICGPLADKVFNKGEASFVDGLQLFMDRGTFVEETFYSFSYSPIRDEAGDVGGLFCPSSEITDKILNTRRLETLSELAVTSLVERTIEAACISAAGTLAKNRQDIPFSLLYMVEIADPAERRLTLVQAVHIDAGIPHISPVSISPDGEAPVWLSSDLMEKGTAYSMVIPYPIPAPAGVAGHPVTEEIIIPVTAPGQQQPTAILVAGINPNRKLDNEYRTFFLLVGQQIGTAIQNAQIVEEERKRAENLAALDRAKTVFFNNISHEFRTPLTLMLGPLEDMLKNPEYQLDEKVRETVDLSHRNALRMMKLVNNLLDFSRIEAGRLKARFEATELGALTEDIASGFRSAIEKEGILYDVACSGLSRPVYVDRDMWEKIVLNLLSNAYKYTLSGRISVELKEKSGAAILVVSDTGVGIPETEQPKVFDRFHRVEHSRGRTLEGSGIGLSLVKELVKLHDGVIDLESQPDAGSVFTVRIPIREPEGREKLEKRERTAPRKPSENDSREGNHNESFILEASRWSLQEHTNEKNGQPDPEGVKKTLLLADDSADMRLYITRLLSDEYEVVAVSDGEEAWKLAQQYTYDMVLADIMMPKLNGFELLKKLRSYRPTAHWPVIFLSGRAGEDAILEGLEAGADDYLIKPFSGKELRARVGNHIMINTIRRETEQSLNELANAMPQLVWVANVEGDVTYYNNRLQEFSGAGERLADNWAWEDMVHPEDLPLTRKLWEKARERNSIYEIEHRLQLADGSYHWFLSRAIPQINEEGRLEKWFGTATDIDAIKKIQQQKDDFLKIASHELRTPITSIRASIQFLVMQFREEVGLKHLPSSGSMETALDIVDKQIRKLSRLLSELLDISKIESGKLLLNLVTFDMLELVEEVRREIIPIHSDHTIRVQDRATATQLKADKNKITQVLTNLLTNAIKYSPDSRDIEVTLLNPTPQEIQVRIKDQGIGIDARDQERIFERFYRVQGTDEQLYPGFGIGLYLAKEIVEQHRGVIAVTSKKGEGSVFSITLPLSDEEN